MLVAAGLAIAFMISTVFGEAVADLAMLIKLPYTHAR
jgi:hypothetical protein